MPKFNEPLVQLKCFVISDIYCTTSVSGKPGFRGKFKSSQPSFIEYLNSAQIQPRFKLLHTSAVSHRRTNWLQLIKSSGSVSAGLFSLPADEQSDKSLSASDHFVCSGIKERR